MDKLLEMTEMTEEEKKRFKEAVDNLGKLREIDDFRDLDKVDFKFEEIDFDDMEDLQHLLDELDELDTEGILGEDIDGKDDIIDIFDDRKDFRYKPEDEKIDINIDEDEINQTDDYHGEIWLGIEDRYETFIDVPDEAEGQLNVSLDDCFVSITGCINKKLPISQLPSDVDSVKAELKENNLVIRVY